jgi:hypothetical protein
MNTLEELREMKRKIYEKEREMRIDVQRETDALDASVIAWVYSEWRAIEPLRFRYEYKRTAGGRYENGLRCNVEKFWDVYAKLRAEFGAAFDRIVFDAGCGYLVFEEVADLKDFFANLPNASLDTTEYEKEHADRRAVLRGAVRR